MEVSAPKEILLQAVQLAEKMTGKKESLPVLSCILLETSDKILTIRSTNLEAGIEVHVPASVKEKGMLAVPAAILRETIRAIQGDTITLKESEGNLIIESRSSKNLIKAIPHDEFPLLPGGEQ